MAWFGLDLGCVEQGWFGDGLDWVALGLVGMSWAGLGWIVLRLDTEIWLGELALLRLEQTGA